MTAALPSYTTSRDVTRAAGGLFSAMYGVIASMSASAFGARHIPLEHAPCRDRFVERLPDADKGFLTIAGSAAGQAFFIP